ncbi:hypothetical protein BGW39_010977 [Mortierella sp. 14UC]|nr:hypothetical protein BGW39_010977 [Mortierella sp. 14UC]
MTTTTAVTSPFDLPELRHRISRFVAIEDALSCALVCKEWTHDFVSAIWYKVDFYVHPRFAELSPDTVSKHGHHIRIAIHTTSPSQVSILANAQVNQLKTLHLVTINVSTSAEVLTGVEQNMQAYEILDRNSNTLQDFRQWASSPSSFEASDILTNSLQTPTPPVPMLDVVLATAMAPPERYRTMPNLKSLELSHMILTYDNFLSILEASPSLFHLALLHTTFSGIPTRSFQHTGLKRLNSGIAFAFPLYPHSSIPGRPSLFSHFPNLTHLWTRQEGWGQEIHSARIKAELAQYCPRLTGYLLSDRNPDIIIDFCMRLGESPIVTELVFNLDALSTRGVMAILSQKSTLSHLELFSMSREFDAEAYEVAAVSNYFQDSSLLLQMIPRECSHLNEFDLFLHEMDMDEVEQAEWACKDLKTLRIRVKGLNTKERIFKAIALWRKGCWRRRRVKAVETTTIGGSMELLVDQQDMLDYPLEARVARHLLKFQKLENVWLGYQTWSPF